MRAVPGVRLIPVGPASVDLAPVGLALVAVALTGLLTAEPTFAQEPQDSTRGDTVRYILPPLEVAVARERSAPPPIGALTIDPVDLRRAQSADPYLLMREVGGLEVHDQGQGPGYASNVVMRGFNSDHSSDVLLVIDGVPVNLPAHGHVEGYADWNVLMPSGVSSLRVLHGNSSPLYGDFALAGAVEVFTRADAQGTEASMGGTTFGDARGSLLTGGRGARGGWLIGGEGRREQGWRDGADHWVANGLLRGWRQVGGGRLEGGFALYGSDWTSPGFVTVPDFNDEVFDPFDATDGGQARRAVLHGRYARSFGDDLSLQATAWGMASDYAFFLHIPGHSHGGGTDVLQQSGEWDERRGVGGQVELGRVTQSGDLVLGFSGRADDARYEHAATLDRDVVNPEIALDAEHRAAAVYARWRRSFGALALDLGGRVDWLQHGSRSDLGDAPDLEAASNVILSPKVGLAWQFDPGWSVFGSSSRGFRSAVGIIGDPTRDPYLAWSHELGVRREGGSWEARLTAFRVDVQNERVFDPISLRSSGAGESIRQGLEGDISLALPFNARAELGGTWNHARLSAPYADAHDDHPHDVFQRPDLPPSEVTDDALRVPGLADYLGRIALSAPIRPGLEASLRWQFTGPHTPIGEEAVRTQAFSVLDLGASIALGPGRTLDLEFGNLLDIRYVELRSSGYVTPGAPRALRVQLRVEEWPF